MIRVALLLAAALCVGALGGSLVMATAPALATGTTTIPKSDRTPVRVVSECRSA